MRDLDRETSDNIDRDALRLLDTVLDLDPDDRPHWLDRNTLGRPELRQRVDALLEAGNHGTSALLTGDARSLIEAEDMPERIGAYRIDAVIGQGGMGTVYRGERDAGDFEHSVAIKVVRPGPLSAMLGERFRNERRILASLTHPGIARLFDGGQTARGEPYLVMEYVEGRTLREVMAEGRQSLDGLLKAFNQMCNAVAHAHQKLVAHGDITPANILVRDDGEAKLIDFGISRVADPSIVAKTPISGPRPAYTRSYAAPERIMGVPASTASDIYSLGAVLSDIISATGSVDAELRAIANKASADDVAARYSSVTALQSDLDRHKDGLPVEAFEGGALYRPTKLVRRHLVLFGSLAAGLIGLLVALVIVTTLYRRAEAARASEAERFAEVRALAGYLLFDLYDAVADLPRSTAVREDMARRAQSYLDRVQALRDPPLDLVAETAEGFRRLGDIQGGPGIANIGQTKESKASYAKATSLLDQYGKVHGEAPQYRVARARVLLSRARADFFNDFDAAGAVAHAQQASAVLQALPATPEAAAWRAVATASEGEFLLYSGQNEKAVSRLKLALSQFAIVPMDKLLPLLAEEAQVRYAAAHRNLALAHVERKQLPLALAALEAGDPIWRRMLAEKPNRRRFLRSYSVHLMELGNVLGDSGRAAESVDALQRASELARRNLQMDPGDEASRFAMEATSAELANRLGILGETKQATAILEKILGDRRARARAEPDNAKRAVDVLVMLRPLGDVRLAARDKAGACAAYVRTKAEFDAFDKKSSMTEELRGTEYALVLERLRQCT